MFSYTYIDTGAMYRAVAVKIIEEGIDYRDSAELAKVLSEIDIEFRRINGEQCIFLNGEDVSVRIREQDITMLSSEIAVIREVREKMVAMQREMGKEGGVIMDGRDIGTVVFPGADFKFYLTASVKIRAIRRWKELKDKSVPVEQIEKDLIWRDHNDSNRTLSPLCKAEDAVEVDTTDMTITEQVSSIMNYIKSRQ